MFFFARAGSVSLKRERRVFFFGARLRFISLFTELSFSILEGVEF